MDAGFATDSDRSRTVESCEDGQDDDDDGRVDESCACTAGASLACWTGSTSTRGVGACRDGTARCTDAEEFAAWGACEGQLLPSSEVAGNCVDEDCDGIAVGCADGCPDGTLDCDGDPTNGCDVPACSPGAECTDAAGDPGSMDCTAPCAPACRTTCPSMVSVVREMNAPLVWPDPTRGESIPSGCRIVAGRLSDGTWSAYPPNGSVDCVADIRIAGASCDPGPARASLDDGTRFFCDFDTRYDDNVGACRLTLFVVPR